MKRCEPCQVQSSLSPWMLRLLNRAEAAGSLVSESTGFPEQRHWHPVFRLSTRQWTFCIPEKPQTPRTSLPVSRACPTTAVPDQRSGTLCKCELSLPPLLPFDDSPGADLITQRVLRPEGGQEVTERTHLRDVWKAFMVNIRWQIHCVISVDTMNRNWLFLNLSYWHLKAF